ncbi:MAG: hypothetical protein NC123_16450 [Butyrivibrio sp.]|nr:hypothetical protein [Acetatifactor muris]MCM1561110.1 hypothetical protein [Butyrivibrio sp.]
MKGKLIEKFRKSGITSSTPKNMLINAAVLYANLKYEDGRWSGDLLGATSGGAKISVVPDYQNIEVDGAVVNVRGMTLKQGESAYIEANLIEMTPEILQMTMAASKFESPVEGYDLYRTKSLLEDSDYIDNIAAIGTLSDGREIIVIMENMLCTSGFEADTKNKDKSVLKCKFECFAGFEDDHDRLPVFIYYPRQKETVVNYTAEMLGDMTVANIETLAAGRGYTLTGSTKDEKIASFLAQQNGGSE